MDKLYFENSNREIEYSINCFKIGNKYIPRIDSFPFHYLKNENFETLIKEHINRNISIIKSIIETLDNDGRILIKNKKNWVILSVKSKIFIERFLKFELSRLPRTLNNLSQAFLDAEYLKKEDEYYRNAFGIINPRNCDIIVFKKD